MTREPEVGLREMRNAGASIARVNVPMKLWA